MYDSLYCRAESYKQYVSHHPTSKHQCTHLGSVLNLSSHASAALLTKNESLRLLCHFRKQKTERHKLKSASGYV